MNEKRTVVDSITDLIGDTPLVRLHRVVPQGAAEVLGKLESLNPGGSVKDRIAKAMIDAAERDGLIRPGGTLVEPTSGNTGVGLAMVAVVKGYRLILTMPEDMSTERRRLFERFGAEVILTPAIEGMSGAVFAAEEIAERPGHFMPQQFQNAANPEVHRQTTAEEIWSATEGQIDAFVAGVGTGGTITGVGEVLKARRPGLLVVAVEPEKSSVLRGGRFGVHGIQGIGASFVPGVLNRTIYDEVMGVTDEDAYVMTARLTREEGILAGISAGANVEAASRIATRLGPDKRVVTVICDTGERYLSVNLEPAAGARTKARPNNAVIAHGSEEKDMSVKVYIPTPFRRLTGNRAFVDADGNDVAGVLRDLEQRFPGFGEMVFDAQHQVLAHVNVYVNNQEISALSGAETPVGDGDEVSVIPAIAGGAALTPEQVDRYSRHLIMEQVGPMGQRRLMDGKVLVVGAGGLGSPVLVYLAAAGVGTIGIVDFDVVDTSNLQRQIIHGTSDVGRPKVDSAADRIYDMNPNVTVDKHNEPLTSENAMEVISQYDIVVNGADNFATRYLVNDACFLAGKNLVDGSIFLFEGQVTTFLPGEGCYRCLYPTPPPPGLVPSCAEAGVLGALPGTVGGIQATEVLKLLLDAGEPLKNRLLLYDALVMEFRTVKIRRDPHCPLCGDAPTVTELIDYEEFCGSPFHE